MLAALRRLRVVVASPVAWGASLLLALGLLALFGHPVACPFRELTGYPCPTCGATRAGLRLLHLDPVGALRANPLVTCAVLALPLLIIARARGLRLPPRLLTLSVLLALALNWLYLLTR